ncbi:MAG: hypothetical protein ACREH6_02540, partial [Geminicoccaceae bacterium]
PGPNTDTVILEAFLPGTEPTMASPAGGATASIAQEVYLGQRSGSNGAGTGRFPVTEPGTVPQEAPEATGQGFIPQITVPQPQRTAPTGSPNTGGLY